MKAPAQLLGLESADNADMGDWTDNRGTEVEIKTPKYTRTEEIRLN